MPNQLSQSKFLIPTMIVIALLAAATGFFVSVKQAQLEQQQAAQRQIPGLFWPEPRQLQSFSIVDHYNQAFELADMKGKWSLVFFGYTNCPDICPITLSVLAESYPAMKSGTDNLQVLFASVDPDRDNTDQLAEYVQYFDEEFIGVGGPVTAMNGFTRQLGVAYFLNNEEDKENYLVDHSASVYLIDPEARLVGKLSPPHNPEVIKQRFAQIKEFINENS